LAFREVRSVNHKIYLLEVDFQSGVNRRMVKMWKNKMPTKVRGFMWLVIQDRI